jgi:hypothetical protein
MLSVGPVTRLDRVADCSVLRVPHLLAPSAPRLDSTPAPHCSPPIYFICGDPRDQQRNTDIGF